MMRCTEEIESGWWWSMTWMKMMDLIGWWGNDVEMIWTNIYDWIEFDLILMWFDWIRVWFDLMRNPRILQVDEWKPNVNDNAPMSKVGWFDENLN